MAYAWIGALYLESGQVRQSSNNSARALTRAVTLKAASEASLMCVTRQRTSRAAPENATVVAKGRCFLNYLK